MLNCCVLSTVLNNSESWTLSPRTRNKLETSEMLHYGRMLRIPWNKDALKKMPTDKAVILNIKKKELNEEGGLGNTRYIEGKGDRRQRATSVTGLCEWIGERGRES